MSGDKGLRLVVLLGALCISGILSGVAAHLWVGAAKEYDDYVYQKRERWYPKPEKPVLEVGQSYTTCDLYGTCYETKRLPDMPMTLSFSATTTNSVK